MTALTKQSIAVGILVVSVAGFTALEQGSCAPPPVAKIEAAAQNFCKLRAAYKAVTAGKLDAPPGTPRAELEQAEDEFCADPRIGVDAGVAQ